MRLFEQIFKHFLDGVVEVLDSIEQNVASELDIASADFLENTLDTRLVSNLLRFKEEARHLVKLQELDQF